jgi:hypothetical protein
MAADSPVETSILGVKTPGEERDFLDFAASFLILALSDGSMVLATPKTLALRTASLPMDWGIRSLFCQFTGKPVGPVKDIESKFLAVGIWKSMSSPADTKTLTVTSLFVSVFGTANLLRT